MKYLVVLGVALLAGCVTMSGFYTVSAVAPDGTRLPTVLHAQGSGVYNARNALCIAHPGATVTVINQATGKEDTRDSPYQCPQPHGQ